LKFHPAPKLGKRDQVNPWFLRDAPGFEIIELKREYGVSERAGKKRHTREREQHHNERDQRWVRKERPKTTPTQNRETGIGATADKR